MSEGSEPPEAQPTGATRIRVEGEQQEYGTIRRSVRLLMLLDSAEAAGIAPLGVLQLHSLAYLSNVLAPVWTLPPLDGKVMKRTAGPFYPDLQRDLDHLVATGVVHVSNLDCVRQDDGHWRLEGYFSLNHLFADPVIGYYRHDDAGMALAAFIEELTYAFSAFSDNDLAAVTSQDASYSDQLTAFGNIVDFGEWKNINYTANAANYFEYLLPGGVLPTLGERLHLYARHLDRRLKGV